MRRVILLLLVPLLALAAPACSDGGDPPEDTGPRERIVDYGTIEGPITRPVEDMFVPLDGGAGEGGLPKELGPGG
jgi:hypothetical protein